MFAGINQYNDPAGMLRECIRLRIDPRRAWQSSGAAQAFEALPEAAALAALESAAEEEPRNTFLLLPERGIRKYAHAFVRSYLGNAEHVRRLREKIRPRRRGEEAEENSRCLAILYLALKELDEAEEADEALQREVLRTIFGGVRTAEGEPPADVFYSRVLLYAILALEEWHAPWQDGYCRIVLGIYRELRDAFPPEGGGFFDRLEYRLDRDIDDRDKMVPDDLYAERYARQILNLGQYRAFCHFLYRLEPQREDAAGIRILGQEPRSFLAGIYALADRPLIYWGRNYEERLRQGEAERGERENAGYPKAEWREDVLGQISRAGNPEGYAAVEEWLALDLYLEELRLAAEEERWDGADGFWEKLERADSIPEPDLAEGDFLRDGLKNLAVLFNLLLAGKQLSEVRRVLKRLGSRNLYRYEMSGRLGGRGQFSKISEGYSYVAAEVERRLQACGDAETLIEIYFNTHLRTRRCLDLARVVRWSFEMAGADQEKVRALWGAYWIPGQVSNVNPFDTRRRYVVDPDVRSVYTRSCYGNYRESAAESGWTEDRTLDVHQTLFFSDQKWCMDARREAALLGYGVFCRFHISGYVRGVGIWVRDIELTDPRQKFQQEKALKGFPGRVLNWLSGVAVRDEKSGSYERWYYKDRVFRADVWEDADERDRIQLVILQSLRALAERGRQDTIDAFLLDLTTPPLEEINEYRYYPEFWTFPREYFRPHSAGDPFVCRVREDAKALFAHYREGRIDTERMRKIYLHTAIRKYVPYREAYEQLGEALFRYDGEPVCLVLAFAGNEDGRARFKGIEDYGGFGCEESNFWCPRELPLKIGWRTRVSVRGYEKEPGGFLLELVDKEDLGIRNRFYRTLYEIKQNNISDGSGVRADISRRLRRFRISYDSAVRVWQFAYELNLIFQAKGCEIRAAEQILLCIGFGNNPFCDTENLERLGVRAEGELREYRETYRRFLENLRRDPQEGDELLRTLIWVYSLSFLRVILPEEEFRRDSGCDPALWEQEQKAIRAARLGA